MKSFTFGQSIAAMIVVFYLFIYVSSDEFTERQNDDKALKEAVQAEQREAAERKRIYARLSAEGAYMTGMVAAK